MARLTADNPFKRELIGLMHAIEDQLCMEKNDIMLILLELNTEEKICRFFQWIKTQRNGEEILAQPNQIVRAACDISDEIDHIVAFAALCMNDNFDTEDATEILSQIDISGEFMHLPVWKGKTYATMSFTPLSMAVFYNNLRMVQYLLFLGADPNVVYNGHQNVLWDLQYNDGETDEENEMRLAIARLLLENGADPKIVVEGEDLYHYVLSCSQDDLGELADYRIRFLDLLEEFVDDEWDEISEIKEHLIKVLHTLMEEHPLEEPEFVLILLSLNTDEKILDYLEWVNSKFDGEKFRVDKHKLIGAAVRIGDRENVPF